MKKEKVILGIDPGTTVMGYGVIRVDSNNMELLAMGSLHLSKYPDHYIKLQRIFKRTISLIDEFHPDELAIEAQFFGKNVQSMLKLGRAQGVSIAAALSRDLPIAEYLPKRIKQAITGRGGASKEQVAAMLQTLLKIDKLPKYLDATDGLAVAVCHHFQDGKATNVGGKSYSNWASFVKDNPSRTKS